MGTYFSNLWNAIRGGNAAYFQPGTQYPGGGVPGGRPVTVDSALSLSAVWACVRLRAEAIGSMPIQVWDKNPDGTRTLNLTHRLNRVLNISPNALQTRNEFFETMSINQDLTGNFYARKTVKGKELISLSPLMSQQVTVNVTAQGARNYVYQDGQNRETFNQKEVWHGMAMPSNAVIGLSPIQYAARTMSIAAAADERVSALAENGFKPTGVLTLDKVLKTEQRDRLQENFKDLADGAGQSLKVLEGGMQYHQISLNPRDVQLVETRKFSVEDIARIYGVPSILINDTQSTTGWGSGISEIKEGFYTLGLRPTLERMESSFKKWLLPPEDRAKYDIEFDFSAFLRGNEKVRTETLVNGVKGGILTPNEARAKESLPPVEGGDKIYFQKQMVPLEDLEEGNVL